MVPAHTLSWIVFLPLGGALVILCLAPQRREAIKTVALCTAALPVVQAVLMVFRFDPGETAFQFVEHYTWAPVLGFEYFVGVDGLSLPLVVLATLVSFLALLTAWSVESGAKGFFALALILETGVLGVFCALDTALLWVFWELVLTATFFLVSLWGGEEGRRAGRQFLILTQTGALAILLALLALRQHVADPLDGGPTFNLILQLDQANHDQWLSGTGVRHWIFAALVFGCGVLIPIYPLHVWQPRLHRSSPVAVPLLVAALVAKLGFYGILRIAWPVLPDAAAWARPVLMTLGGIAAIHGGLGALGRRDLAVILGYGSFSLLGLALIGLGSFTLSGVQGAGLLLVTHGLVYAMLFAAAGGLYDRKGNLDLERWCGLYKRAPVLGALFTLALLAAWGLPGLAIYPGAALTLAGALVRHPLAALAGAVGLLLAAAWTSRVILKVCLGEPSADLDDLPATRGRELGALVPLALLVLLLGLYPRLLADLTSTTLAGLVRVVGG
ncbi:MAG TPA: NADH-quinone oxidoreductase subunit M [Candidatus Krumholzibacteria bacterium]|nr:NADH-quinone oxidoreductase subunit M [Candidatus Krumholzibacteria bacterium]HPD70598.1 NADH-quinone oxidoreductase subunit M [Candidatus Krumholzibacteria bacterium]HRY39702.1 NADH-quinone oxidoreductase subunit M [Candidatus Krumholzibacteria bacterium]